MRRSRVQGPVAYGVPRAAHQARPTVYERELQRWVATLAAFGNENKDGILMQGNWATEAMTKEYTAKFGRDYGPIQSLKLHTSSFAPTMAPTTTMLPT